MTRRVDSPPGSAEADAIYPRDACIHELFEEQARRDPHSVAVEAGGSCVSYEELNRRADRLATHLRQRGVKREMLVGICVPRSAALIVGLLAILKAGGAYVGLDPEDPPRQLALMLEDSGISLVITGDIPLDLPLGVKVEQLHLNADGSAESGDVAKAGDRISSLAEEPHARVHALDLAYVSFTSGSTGQPKGVCIPHRGVVRLVKGNWYARLAEDEVFIQLAPVAFDASTFEIWGALLNGARLVMFPPEPPSHASLADVVESSGVTTMWLTAGFFHRIVEQGMERFRGLRQLLVGGDILSVPHVQKAVAALPGCQIINGYGPTENTTFTCCHPILRPVSSSCSIPIGKPVAGTQVHVLDDDLKPLPPGEAGELYVGGDGLARGYLNRPDRTMQKFIPSPFRPGAMLYRTGDLVRTLADGSLEFLGRLDRQVKIRGFRVEPSGIEAVLTKHPDVHEAVVIAIGPPNHRYLGAYIVPEPGRQVTTKELHTFLRQHLPKYMMPTAFRAMSDLALTPSGKIDRDALPPLNPGQKIEEQPSSTPPQTTTEKTIAKLWCETLGIRHAGIDESFCEAGGDSLQAVTLLSLIDQRLGKQLPLVSLVKASTIRTLASLLDDQPRSDAPKNAFVVPIRSTPAPSARDPLFLIHGQVGDELTCYLHVAAGLLPEQPVFGLPSRDLVDGTELETIEDMAASHVRFMRATQSHGPYHLAGYCFGGLLAFEMAQQLHAAGEEVGLLIVMDYPLNQMEPMRLPATPRLAVKFLGNFCRSLIDFAGRRGERWQILRRSAKRAGRFVRRLTNRATDEPSLEQFTTPTSLSAEQTRRLERQYQAWRTYEVRAYPGVLTLFRPRRLPLFHPYDETLGWNAIATGGLDLHVIPVPGFHGHMLRAPYAEAVADHLNECLTKGYRPEPDHGQRGK